MKFYFDVEHKTVDVSTLDCQDRKFRYIRFNLNQVGGEQPVVGATFTLSKSDIEWILESDV